MTRTDFLEGVGYVIGTFAAFAVIAFFIWALFLLKVPPRPERTRSLTWDWGNDPTYVYYFYDVQGNLLYVGITNNLKRRWAQHAEDKPWWHLVARKESVQYSTRAEAEKVEAHQIRTHRPMFNRALNGWIR